MKNLIVVAFFFVLPAFALGQSAGLQLGGLSFDANAPIETSADSLTITGNGTETVFTGNVVVGQGKLRLSADRVAVTSASAGGIAEMNATGNVTFVTPQDAIEAQSAVYSLADQKLVLTGEVLISQGQSAIMGDKVDLDLTTGAAVVSGNVRTILQSGAAQ